MAECLYKGIPATMAQTMLVIAIFKLLFKSIGSPTDLRSSSIIQRASCSMWVPILDFPIPRSPEKYKWIRMCNVTYTVCKYLV